MAVSNVDACTWVCNEQNTEFESCFDFQPFPGDYADCRTVRQCMPCGQGNEQCCITYCNGHMCMQV